jgi:iron complex outermembrane receptor protein
MGTLNAKSVCTRLLTSVSLGAIIIAAPIKEVSAQAVASNASTAGQPDDLFEIVVTARKRSEKLLDVPVAVTAFSDKYIDTTGITSLEDVAAFTPGFTVDGTLGGSGRNDRSFQEYVIRGMVPSSTTNPTTSIFINGAPISTGQIAGVDDNAIARVEVLKGPQSAYFGRETFAGAVNLVTKDPGNQFGGAISTLYASHNDSEVRAALEGPIVEDKLAFRATFRNYMTDGSYKNAAPDNAKAKSNETLGDQSTRGGTLELVAHPIDDLKVTLFGMMWHDSDGPSAQAQVFASSQFAPNIPVSANCTIQGSPYICGTVSKWPSVFPSANTLIDSQVSQMLNQKGYLTKPNSSFGLERDAYHGSAGLEYLVQSLGVTINTLTAYNGQKWSELQDLDNYGTDAIPNSLFAYGLGQPFSNFDYLIQQQNHDFSQEVRATSRQDSPFRWMIGGNYAYSYQNGDGAGLAAFGLLPPSSFGINEATTIGVFYGLAYDILPDLTLNFEGRYQTEKLVGYTADYAIQGEGHFHDFLPRATLQYKFDPDLMTYATFSQGVNPGAFNTQIASLSAASQASIAAQGAGVVVQPEHLDNYELGTKGRFLDGRATLSADVYYDVWTKQIVTEAIPAISAIGQTTLAALEFNTGKSTLKGIEVEGTLEPIQHLILDGSVALNDTRTDHFGCSFATAVGCSAANPFVSGTQLPNVSKYQAHFGISYGDKLDFIDNADWYARIDDIYKSGQWAEVGNFAKTPDTNIVNLRAGLNIRTWRLEGFVNNLTNCTAPTNLSPDYALAAPFEPYGKYDTLVIGLPVLRTFGVRAKYVF